MFAIEAEGVGIPTKARDTGASAFIIGARGSLVYNIMPGQIAGGKFVPFVLAGVGFFNVASSNGDMSTDAAAYRAIKKDTDFEFHGGVGAKYFFTTSSACGSTRARSASPTRARRATRPTASSCSAWASRSAATPPRRRRRRPP